MTRRSIYSGSKFEDMAGYARATVDGDWVFVSATAGTRADGSFADTAEDQARDALATIRAALDEAGAGFADVLRIRVYLADRADVVPVSALLGAIFADPRPTNTTILCGFPVEAIKVEFEVTARIRG